MTSMTARFSRAAQQSVEFARKARGHRPRLQLTEYRLNSNSSTSGVLNLAECPIGICSMLNSQCSILIRTEGGCTSPSASDRSRSHSAEFLVFRGNHSHQTSTSAENCASGIEHWSDPRSDAEPCILPSSFCASPEGDRRV